MLEGTVFRYSHGFYLFPVLARILAFSSTDTDSTIFWFSWGQFFGTRMNFTFSRYSPGFYRFPVLVGTVFRCSHGCYLFPVLARILAFSDLDNDSTIYCYSSGMFFGTRPDSTFSRYSTGFYRFQLLTLILPFFGTRRHSFSVLARILLFPGTLPDFTVFRS